MTALALTSAGFMAIHAVPATELRAVLIGRLGERAYLGLFSLLSLILIVLMARAYGATPPGATLWIAGWPLRLVIAVLMIVPFWLVVAGATERNPAAVGGGALLAENAAPHGVFTITRHPLLIGIAVWGGLHLLANPDLPSLVFFGSLIATALGGARLQDRRKEREIGTAWRRYLAQTSFMPFRAAGEGRTRLDPAGLASWRTIVALVLWAVLLTLHGAIIGAPALAF